VSRERQVPEGLKVEITHSRLPADDGFLAMKLALTRPPSERAFRVRQYAAPDHKLREANIPIATKGGVTEVFVLTADGILVGRGRATCSPLDAYNKHVGRAIALGRALKDMGVEKPPKEKKAA